MGGPIIGAGIVLSAYGTYRGLRAQEKARKAQAQTDRINAEIKKERIKDVRGTTARITARVAREGVEFAADQVTAFASAGVDVSSAVVGEAVEATARTTSADISELQHNARKQIWGIKTGVMSDTANALLKEGQARRLGKLAPIATAGTLALGFGELFSPSPLERAKT